MLYIIRFLAHLFLFTSVILAAYLILPLNNIQKPFSKLMTLNFITICTAIFSTIFKILAFFVQKYKNRHGTFATFALSINLTNLATFGIVHTVNFLTDSKLCFFDAEISFGKQLILHLVPILLLIVDISGIYVEPLRIKARIYFQFYFLYLITTSLFQLFCQTHPHPFLNNFSFFQQAVFFFSQGYLAASFSSLVKGTYNLILER